MTASDGRPLVTFALITYNQEQFIRQAIEGAFAQTYQPLEIIVSDDCSTDGTFEVVQATAAEYRGSHAVRLNRNDRNLGIVGHVNRVFAMARGCLIVAAAGDDVSLPNRVEALVELWSANDRKPDGLCSGYIAASGTTERYLSPPGHVTLESHCRQATSGVLGATAAWTKVLIGGWPSLPVDGLVEDRVLTLRALFGGGVAVVDKPLVWSRRDRGQDARAKASWRARELWRLRRNTVFLSVYEREIEAWEAAGSDRTDRAGLLLAILRKARARVDRDARLLAGGRSSLVMFLFRLLAGSAFHSPQVAARLRLALRLTRRELFAARQCVELDPDDHRALRRGLDAASAEKRRS